MASLRVVTNGLLNALTSTATVLHPRAPAQAQCNFTLKTPSAEKCACDSPLFARIGVQFVATLVGVTLGRLPEYLSFYSALEP